MTSSTSSSKPGPLQAAAAVLSPLLILAAATAWLGQAPDEAVLSEAAAEIEATLAEAPPQVLVVGNSLAHSDIDPDQLAEALSLPKGAVSVMYSPGSRAPWWYAALKNRVYENDHAPELVVVVNTMSSLLSTEPHTEWAWQHLRDQMTDYEPVLQEHVFGTAQGSALWERMKAKRLVVRTGILDGARDRVVTALHGVEAEPALDRIFEADGAVDMDLHSRVIPVVEESEDVMDRQGTGTLLPELLDLIHSGGSRAVFVRVPLSSGARAEDDLPPAEEREAILALNEAGAGYLNLREADFTDADFVDPRHMSTAGRTRLTAQVAEGLLTLGALSEEAMPAAELSRALRVEHTLTRDGSLPAADLDLFFTGQPCRFDATLPFLDVLSPESLLVEGLGRSSPLQVVEGSEALSLSVEPLTTDCEGAAHLAGSALQIATRSPEPGTVRVVTRPDFPLHIQGLGALYWLLPDTTVTAAITDRRGADTPATLRLRVVGEQLPTVSLDGAPVTLTSDGPDRVAQVTLPGGTGTLVVTGAAESAALLRGLTVGPAGDAVELLETGTGTPTSLLGERIVHTGTPPTLSAPAPVAVEGKGVRAPVYAFSLPDLAPLADDGILKRRYRRRASPIEVLEDGTPLVSPASRKVPPGQKVLWPSPSWWTARCAWIDEADGTRYCHTGSDMLLLTADRTAPDPSRYTLRLSEDRRFSDLGWWLYPGDRMVAVTKALSAADLPHGATALQLGGLALSEDDTTPLTVLVRADGDVLLRTEVPASQLNDGPVTLALPQLLLPPLSDIRVIVSRPEEAGYTVITDIGLLHRIE